MLRHGVGHADKKIASQVGRGMVRAIGEGVAAVKKIPVLCRDTSALVRGEADAGFVHTAAFLLDLLALFSLKAGQELREIGVRLWAAVDPMKLQRAAHHPTRDAGRVLII